MISREHLEAVGAPDREPYQHDDTNQRLHIFERTAFVHWLPTDDEPGMLVALHRPDFGRSLYTQAKAHFQRLEDISSLGEIGLHPALAATGITLQRRHIPGQPFNEEDSTLLALTIPRAEDFCIRGTAFLARTHPAEATEAPFRFIPYREHPPHYTPRTLAGALAERSLPIAVSDKAIGYHDVIEHAIAWLGIPPDIISYPQRLAQQALTSYEETGAQNEHLASLARATEISIAPEMIAAMLEGELHEYWPEFLGTEDQATLEQSAQRIEVHLTTMPDRAAAAGYPT